MREVSEGEKQKMEQLQEALAAASNSRSELETALQEASERLSEAQTQKSYAQQALEEKCAVNDQLVADLADTREQRERLQQQLVDLAQQATEREEGLSQEIADLRAQLVVAQAKVMEAASAENTMQAENEESEAATKALRDQLQDQQQLLALAEVGSIIYALHQI